MYLSLRDWIVDEADEELDGVAAGEGQVARASLVAHHAPAAQTKHMCVDDKCLRLKVWSLENVKVKGIHEFAFRNIKSVPHAQKRIRSRPGINSRHLTNYSKSFFMM